MGRSSILSAKCTRAGQVSACGSRPNCTVPEQPVCRAWHQAEFYGRQLCSAASSMTAAGMAVSSDGRLCDACKVQLFIRPLGSCRAMLCSTT